MANETALYMKFPCVLRDKLLNGELHFPPNTRFAYEKIFTYSAYGGGQRPRLRSSAAAVRPNGHPNIGS